MARRIDSHDPGSEFVAPQMEASNLDEACFLAELRLAVEGARTAAEERLAQRHPRWTDRLDQVCARLAR